MSDIVVGIDLGTTNSLIGVVQGGETKLLSDDQGEVLLPSVVGQTAAGGIIVGRAARNQRVLAPERTVLSVKRQMGQDIEVPLGAARLSPPQVSALILRTLADRAEQALKERPTRAIITVPAYFNDAQRQATVDAGSIAGLTVERLVNEPTAAALSYQTGGEETVMVYDLGGGTFDVSVLERDGVLLEVTASHGDTHLGGDDIDEALYRWVLAKLGENARVIEADPRARARVLAAVERAKVALSNRTEVRLFDPFVAGEGAAAVSLDVGLTEQDLAEVCRPFIERTLRSIDEAVRAANMSPRDLDRVILVGGSSRLAIVRELVTNHLDMPAQLSDDADQAVAIGATRLAGRAMGADVAEVLLDITPHTLSVGALDRFSDEEWIDGIPDSIASPIILRGTVVPVERTRTYFTAFAEQRAVDIPIAQGERHLLKDNTELGEISIDDLPIGDRPAPVEVTFRLDLSGVLHVSATHVPSGKSARTRIVKSGARMTAKGRAAAAAELEALGPVEHAADADGTVTAGDRSLAEAMLKRAERAIAKDGDGSTEVRQRIGDAVAALKSALEDASPRVPDLTDDLSDALLDLL